MVQKIPGSMNKNKSNGNRPQLPSEQFMNSLVSNSEMPSVFRELLHPGKDPVELLMRTILPDEAKANAAVLLLHRIQEFKLGPDIERLVLMKIASFAAIKGMSRREAVMAATGVISSALYDLKYKKQKEDKQERREDQE